MDEADIYIDLLASDDFATKRMAIEVLGELGDSRALPALLNIFNDEEWQIRNTAVDAIVKIDRIKAIEPLISLLRDENASVRNAAISALELVGEKAVDSLLLGLSDPDEDLQIFTANTLGLIKASSAVPCLLECIERPDINENVKFAAIEALGRIKSYDATLPIIQHLQKADEWDRFNYLNTLGNIGDERATDAVLQCYENEITLEAALTTAGLIGDEEVVNRTIEALYNEDPDIQKAAILALYHINAALKTKQRLTGLSFGKANFQKKIRSIDYTRFTDTIHEIFADDNLRHKQAVLKILKFTPFLIRKEDLEKLLDKEELLDELVELVEFYQVHPSENISNLFDNIIVQGEQFLINFFSLANSCSIQVSDKLILQALNHPYSEIKNHVIIYCGLQGVFSPQIISEFIGFISNSSDKLAKSAEGALIMHQDEEFKSDIAGYLVSGNDALESFALHYIAFNEFEISEEILLAYLSKPSERVRTQAIKTIRMSLHNGSLQRSDALEDKLLELINDESEQIQHEAITTLGHFLSPALIADIIPTISGLRYNPKVHGIKVIATFPCEETDDFLIALLEDPHPEMKLTAINAMKKCSSPQKVLQALVDCIDDFEVDLQGEIIEVIGEIGSRKHISLLETFLKRENWFLKVSSIKAMGRLKEPSAIPSLIALLNDLQREEAFEIILEALTISLGNLGAVDAVKPLCNFLSVTKLQTTIARAFQQIGEKDLGHFIDLSKNGETRLIRLISVSVLSLKGHEDAAFFAEIIRSEEFISVRRAAAEALSLHADKAAVQQEVASLGRVNDSVIEEILARCC